MIALAGVGRFLDLAQQRIHLRRLQLPAGPDRAVAGHRRGERFEALPEADAAVPFGKFLGKVGAKATTGYLNRILLIRLGRYGIRLLRQ